MPSPRNSVGSVRRSRCWSNTDDITNTRNYKGGIQIRRTNNSLNRLLESTAPLFKPFDIFLRKFLQFRKMADIYVVTVQIMHSSRISVTILPLLDYDFNLYETC